jgi:hypothetical protein
MSKGYTLIPRSIGYHMVRIRQLLLPLLIRPNKRRIRNPTRYQDSSGGQYIPIFLGHKTDESEEGYRNRDLYNRTNAFFTSAGVDELLEKIDDEEKAKLLERIEEIKEKYRELSEVYQKSKGGAGIPLA